MWYDLEEQVNEEFNELQSDITWAHFDRSVMEPLHTHLSDEVDPQEWQKHIQLTTPMPTCQETEPTCLCTNTSRRRWKNQYGEGIYIHINTYMANSWSNQDLEEMATNTLPEPKEPLVPFPIKETSPVKEINDFYSDQESHVRIQISLKQKATNVKGRYKNFELKNIPIEEIFNACQSLLSFFPKQKRSMISYYTRVQLQNKVGNSMKGGMNLSVHNATPEEVYELLFEIFDGSGWFTPKGAAPREVNPQKESGILGDRRSRSEDGSPKAGNQSVILEGGRGVISHTQKLEKKRTNILEALKREIALRANA